MIRRVYYLPLLAILPVLLPFATVRGGDPQSISLEQLRESVLAARESFRSAVLKIETETIKGDDTTDSQNTIWLDGEYLRIDRDFRYPPHRGRATAILLTGQDRFKSFTVLGPDEYAQFSMADVLASRKPVIKIARSDQVDRAKMLPIDPCQIGWRIGTLWPESGERLDVWPLVDDPDDTTVEAVTHEGRPCWEVRYSSATEMEVRVVVSPEQGNQVVQVSTAGLRDESSGRETLTLVVHQQTEALPWYPTEIRYQRWDEDQLALEEISRVEVSEINRPHNPENFQWENLGIPEGFARRRMLESGEYETTVDDNLLTWEPDTPPNHDQEKRMKITASLIKALLIFLIYGFFAMRSFSKVAPTSKDDVGTSESA